MPISRVIGGRTSETISAGGAATNGRGNRMRRLLLAVLLTVPRAVAAKTDKNLPFVGGSSDENRLTREVRPRLLMLPSYRVCDNLTFRVDGSAVTMAGMASW